MKEVYIYSKEDRQQKLRGEAIGTLIGLIGWRLVFWYCSKTLPDTIKGIKNEEKNEKGIITL